MFWEGAVAVARLLMRDAAGGSEVIESTTSEATETSKTYELSSIQRESSGSNGNLSLHEWPSVKPLVTGSSFSEVISDRVTAEQQRKEEHDAMAPARDSE